MSISLPKTDGNEYVCRLVIKNDLQFYDIIAKRPLPGALKPSSNDMKFSHVLISVFRVKLTSIPKMLAANSKYEAFCCMVKDLRGIIGPFGAINVYNDPTTDNAGHAVLSGLSDGNKKPDTDMKAKIKLMRNRIIDLLEPYDPLKHK